MILIQRHIANLNIAIEGESSRFMSQLEQELDIYPLAQHDPDILIRFGFVDKDLVLAKNPATHSEYEDGFSANFGNDVVRWHWGRSPVLVDWVSQLPEKLWRQKIRNIQYAHPYEQIGQVFFELVLIPTLQLFYHHRLLLLHGSALSDNSDDEAIIFGGTGGVGKTSLELSLVGKGYRFMADDISILDSDGVLHANFSWPKIYGYNTQNDMEMKDRIFQTRGRMDKLFWEMRTRRLGSSRVRRRVDPQSFFYGAVNQQARLKTYYFLFRDRSKSLAATPLSADDAIDMSLNIMMSEYTILYRHLYWHQVNRIGLALAPFVTADTLFDSWRVLGEKLFANIRCYLVHVPMDTTATTLRVEFTPLLNQ